MANSKRKCKQCGEYKPTSEGVKAPAGFFCSYEHACEFGKQKAKLARERASKKKHTERKRKLRNEDRGYQLKKAQAEFNRYIRLRDKDEPCICCGKHYNGQYHAGHYLSVGSHPELRFNEDNCHRQKSSCNTFKSGNQAQYRIRLIEKIGLARVEALEGPREPLNLSVEQIKGIRKKYKKLADALEKETE